ncbi:MAG: AAA family ATPase [Microthrixaceae bacterium]
MQPPAEFIGRGQALRQTLAALDGSRCPVNLWGVPGIGKSTFCSEVARRLEDAGTHVVSIDLEQIVSGNQVASLVPEALARAVVTALSIGPRSPKLDSPQLDRAFDAALKKAAADFASSHAAVVVRQRATHGARIENTQIHVGESVHRLMVALQQYRHDVASAARGRLAGLEHLDGSVLIVDTAEVLYQFDDRSGETNAETLNFGLAKWFLSEVLDTISQRTGLRLLVAGREVLDGEFSSEPVAVELTEWSTDESEEFGLSSGLPPEFAADLHSLCHGVPIWTSLVVEVWRTDESSGPPPTPESLRAMARARPAERWLPAAFLRRLDGRMRAIVRAAAVPRVVTRGAIGALMAERRLSDSEWERLCSHAFIQLKPVGGIAGRRFLHSLIRTAILAHLEAEEPAELRRLHQAAAVYFDEESQPIESFYHQFASGDASGFAEWNELIESHVERFDFDVASQLVDAALTEDHAVALRADAPGVEGHALIWRARIHRSRDQIDAAIAAYNDAIACFEGYGATAHEIESHLELARLEWRCGDVVRAAEGAERALRLARATNDRFFIARILEVLGGLSHTPAALAVSYLTEARYLYSELGEDHDEADVILALADLAEDDASRLKYYDEALEVFVESGCSVGRAQVLRRLAGVKFARDLTDEASVLLDEAERLFQTSEANEERAEVLRSRAHILASLHRYPEAHELLLEAAEIYRVAREPSREARIMRQLAVVSTDWLGLQSAFDFLANAVAKCEEIEDVHGIASTLETLGNLQERHQSWPFQKESYERALEGYSSCSEWSGMIRIWRRLAYSASVALDLDVACDYAQRAFKVAEGQRPALCVELALELGSLHLGRPLIGLYFSPWEHAHPFADEAQLQRSTAWYRLAEELSSRNKNRRLRGLARKGLGDNAVARQDWEGAIQVYTDATADLRAERDRLSVAWLTQAVADCLVELGREVEARPLFTEAMYLFDETNETWT